MIARKRETNDNSEKTSTDPTLKATALTGIDDELIVEAMENKPIKRRIPWLAAAAALTALIAGGLIISHLLKPDAMQQDAMISANPMPTEQPADTGSKDGAAPTEHRDPPTGNPIPSYSVWEDKLPSATQAPNLYTSIDDLADAIRHGDQKLIETIDRVYLPGNLPRNASFRCIRPYRNPVVEYTLIGSDPEDGSAIVLLFQKGWSDFDIGSYLRADNRIYEEHDGLFIVTGYNEGDPRIGNMPAAGNLKNVYWTREEGLFLLRVPRSYSVERIRALTELECVLLPNADQDFKPYEIYFFDSLDEFLDALQTGDHSGDELGTLDMYYLLGNPPSSAPIRSVYVDPELFQLDYYENDDSRLIFNWLRREDPADIETLIERERSEMSSDDWPLTTRMIADGITVIEGLRNATFAFWTENGSVFSLVIYGIRSDAELIGFCSAAAEEIRLRR